MICTKDRPVELARLLSSIQLQSRQPQQMIVVDGGGGSAWPVVEQFQGMNIEYAEVDPPSLTKQKNAGTSLVNPTVSLIGFMDDDFMLEEGSLEAMMSFWEGAPSRLGGASFNLTGFKYSNSFIKSIPKRIFGIDDREYGRVLRSGFNTPIWSVPETQSVRWLCGGATIWRKEVLEQWQFDEWFTGSGLWEDVRFSYRAGRKYDLAIVAPAKGSFLAPPISGQREFALGKTQVVNWVYFVGNNPNLSLTMCFWACSGRAVANLAKGLASLNSDYIFRGTGNLYGIASALITTLNPLNKRPVS